MGDDRPVQGRISSSSSIFSSDETIIKKQYQSLMDKVGNKNSNPCNSKATATAATTIPIILLNNVKQKVHDSYNNHNHCTIKQTKMTTSATEKQQQQQQQLQEHQSDDSEKKGGRNITAGERRDGA